jgi:hypothetical protein
MFLLLVYHELQEKVKKYLINLLTLKEIRKRRSDRKFKYYWFEVQKYYKGITGNLNVITDLFIPYDFHIFFHMYFIQYTFFVYVFNL